jgi:hypothetical protein
MHCKSQTPAAAAAAAAAAGAANINTTADIGTTALEASSLYSEAKQPRAKQPV